ncbi:hypothetical protein LOCC1_G004942 [Lachnellula occidentalis]|uniref:Uncharacterized protein n=1 Tax=Lachnellula occidentalis TaxID=215460 RepID=A0A8H8RV41_9HELO|nr:hypothetical protein LOCC1_G004942 [Lachnellula occidentalis]
MNNFILYFESVIREISDADACIWAMGTYDGNHQVEVEYPTAFAKAMLQERKAGKFRYVHLGGAFTVEDQDKTLYFMPDARRGRGLGEFTMRNFAKENGCEERWETIVMRPSGVLKKDRFRFLNLAIADTIGFISEHSFSRLQYHGDGINLGHCIGSDECAASMIDVALHGSTEGVWQNNAMVVKGRALLEQ